MMRRFNGQIHQTVRWGALILGLGLAMGTSAADIEAYTEDWAPYNFEENGEVKGISTDILRAACAKAKLQCTFSMVPWARAYKTAQTQYQALAYTTARRPDRENEFLWVGPILPRTTWVYQTSATRTPVQNLGDLAKLRIGVVRGEAAEKDLLAAGVPATALSQQATNTDVLRMLRAGDVDAMVDTEVGMRWNMKTAGATMAGIIQTIKLTDAGGYYFAINPATPVTTVKKLQDAVDELRSKGKITKITRRYLGTP
jgi:polar amino acid transport system substrate-binding protein